MKIYNKLTHNKTAIKIMKKLFKTYKNHIKNKRTKGKYKFIDRKNNNKILCVILAVIKNYYGTMYSEE